MKITQITSDLYGANNYGGAKAKIDSRNVTFGSVRGYTIYNIGLWNVHSAARVAKECADTGISIAQYIVNEVEADLERAKSRKEKLVWINVCATVIHNGPRSTEFDNVPDLNVGDVVDFDGKLYTIAPDHNKNYRLVEIV